MPARSKEIRPGDSLTIEAKVSRVSEDGEDVTIEVWGQKITRKIAYADYLVHEKGPLWGKKN